MRFGGTFARLKLLKLRDIAKKFGVWVGLFAGVATLVSMIVGLYVLSSDVADLKRESIAMREQVDDCSDGLLKAQTQALITQERYTNIKLYVKCKTGGC